MMIFVVQVLPPIRSKKKKIVQKPVTKEEKCNTNTKRIKSSDYSAWDKFDVVSSLIFLMTFIYLDSIDYVIIRFYVKKN